MRGRKKEVYSNAKKQVSTIDFFWEECFIQVSEESIWIAPIERDPKSKDKQNNGWNDQ